MGKITWQGGALLAPVPPTLVTCGDGDGNVLTVAWTGILATRPPKTYISVRPERYSHSLIESTREFCINLPTAALARAVDRCGVYTGAKVDKFVKSGLTRDKCAVIGCPSVTECPVCIECRVTDVVGMGSHDMFVADIVAVRVDDSLIDESGRLRLEKAGLLAFAHGAYYALGRRIGKLGFAVRKKR